MTAGLVQFLRARLDEDEAVASAAAGREGGGSWTVDGTTVRAADGAPVLRHTWAAEGEHITRHDPARTLREVQAHRTTVDEFDIALWAQVDDDQAAYWQGHRDTLRAACLRLATAYADHPAFAQAVASDQG